MILFLLLLILAGVGVAIYAAQNTAMHPVTFLQWHWSAVSDWVPVVITAVVIGGLFLLYMIYAGMVHGVRVGSMRRRVSTREQAIDEMRDENVRLREENARIRGELRARDRCVGAVGADRPVAATRNPNVDREPVTTTGDVDRSRTAEPYRARPTFGERVRAFFSGREPAGY
jgi:uncharacterized integral membrane protein